MAGGAGGVVDPRWQPKSDEGDDGWFKKWYPERYAYFKKQGFPIPPDPNKGVGGGGGGPSPKPPATGGGPTVPPTGGGPGVGTGIPIRSPAAEEPSLTGLRAAAGMGSGGFGDIAGVENLGGPSMFRQGIGTRIPPQYTQALAALMKVY